MHTVGGQGREALRGSPPATKTSLPLNPTSYRTAAPYFPQAFSGKWERKWLWVPRILFHPGILSCSLCLFAQICSAIVQTAGKHRWWQTRRFLVLGQRYYAELTRANARRVKMYAWASRDESKKSSLFSLSLSTYMAFSCASHQITNLSLQLPAKEPGLDWISQNTLDTRSSSP